jgi:hypothetical protein
MHTCGANWRYLKSITMIGPCDPFANIELIVMKKRLDKVHNHGFSSWVETVQDGIISAGFNL